MKKTTITITALGLFAFLLCGIVFYLSCKRKVDCSGCYLTNEQLKLIIYTTGEKVFFKNDMTNISDTLNVGLIRYGQSTCSMECDQQYQSAYEDFTFNRLSPFSFSVFGGQGIYQYPNIDFSGKSYYTFILNVPTQTAMVNSTTYNDVYSVQIDSTAIATLDKQTIPWKIYYSKSAGFIRFYMMNGQTWSKL